MTESNRSRKASIRWWPGIVLALVTFIALAWVRAQDEWPFQKRNLTGAQILIGGSILLLVWWTFFSRVPNRWRLSVTFGAVGAVLLSAALFRFRGMSGDMFPLFEFRWANRALPAASSPIPDLTNHTFNPDTASHSFPQYLGPNRDGVLGGPQLETNWTAHPPAVLWRQKIGAGWSGFVIVGAMAITQEQRGADESVIAYDLLTGKALWQHTDVARYHTVIAGEGPRATPTVISNRVLTCGSTGILNCLDLATGKRFWTRDLIAESGGKVPQWGYTCAPLVAEHRVIVHGGEGSSRSLLAFDLTSGERLWAGGSHSASYSSPRFATLAGVPQILAFNDGSISGHDPATGATLWEKPWGNGNVVCAAPVVVSSNQVLFSSGYGVGAELLEISAVSPDRLTAQRVWKSIRMKAKFAHLFARDGSLFGLDDGIFACVNLADGSQRWKEGRYGHGQGLLVNDLYLLMAESGELVLLRPTPEAPNELARFRVFHSKTWNPIALSGDLLLVRNDQEAACLRLKIRPE